MRRSACLRRFIRCVCVAVVVAMQASSPCAGNFPLQQMGLGAGPHSVAWSQSGNRILTAGEGSAYLWESETGETIRAFNSIGARVSGVGFLRSDQYVLTASHDGLLRLWSASTGEFLRALDHPHPTALNALALSPDRSRFATGSADGRIALWSTTTLTRSHLVDLSGEIDQVTDLAFSPDGSLLLVGGPLNSFDGAALLLDPIDGESIVSQLLDGNVDSVAFSPDGAEFAVGGAFLGRIQRFDLSGNPIASHQILDAIHSPVVYTPAGTGILFGSNCYDSGSRISCVRQVILENGTFVTEASGFEGTISDLQFSRDGAALLITSTGGTAKLLQWPSGGLTQRFIGHTSSQRALAALGDGIIVTGSSTGQVARWDTRTGILLAVAALPGGAIHELAQLPSGELLAADGSGLLRLLDQDSLLPLGEFVAHGRAIRTLAVRNQTLLSGSENGEASVWGLPLNEVATVLTPEKGIVWSAVLTDNAVFVGSNTGEILRWNSADLSAQPITALAHRLGSAGVPVFDLVATSDGATLYSGGFDGIIRRWNAASLGLVDEIAPLRGAVHSLASSADDRWIAAGTASGSIHVVWTADDPATSRTLAGHTQTVDELRFQVDRGGLLSTSLDGRTHLYELRPPRAIVVAGGGPYPGNSIAQQTNDLGIYTYRTLLARGYSPEDVLYLSAFPEGTTFPIGQPAQGEPVSWDVDGDGIDDVDGEVTREALQGALTGDFAREAGRLLVLMVDHGYKTNEFMAFRLSPSEAVRTTEVNAWLNELQNAAPVDVTLVVDCCYSGHFVEDCRKTAAIPTARDRIVIASTSKDNEAVFLPAPDLTSFMYTFLGSAYMGNSVGESFRSGARFFSAFPVAGQQPIIDDGEVQTTGVELATTRANREFFGASWAYGVQADNNINRFFPAFESVAPTGSISPGSPVTVQAVMRPSQTPRRVKVVIRPPAAEVLSGEPVVGLPYKILDAPVGGSPETGLVYSYTWQPTDSDSPFSLEGLYRITFTAEFDNLRLSDPEDTSVVISSEPDPDTTPIRAVLAFDNAAGAPGEALALAGDFAHARYLDKFQERAGTTEPPVYTARPEWIDYLTNNATTMKEKSPRRHEQAVLAAESRKSGRLSLTKASLLSSIAARGTEAGRLYVHLAALDASGGVLSIAGETITAAELDEALDAVQAEGTEVVLVLDASGSGSFLPACAPTPAQSRLVLTSTAASECGVLLANPPITYTHKLMGPLWSGETYAGAHNAAASFFTNFVGEFAGTRIEPQLEDGIAGAFARSRWLGRSFAFAGDEASGLPFVVQAEVLPPDGPGQRPRLRARLMEGVDPVNDGSASDPDSYRVFAQVTPRGLVCGTGATELPRIRLRRDDPTAWTWSAPVSDLIEPGLYPVTFVAEYPDGDGFSRESTPVFRTLDLGETTGSAPDAYEPEDNAPAAGALLAANGTAQQHTIHQTLDEDWYRLLLNGEATDGTVQAIPHTLRFANVVLPAGASLQVSIALDGASATLPAPVDCVSFEDTLCATVSTPSREIVFLTNGIEATQRVLVRVALLGTAVDPHEPVSYTIDLYRSTGANNGIVASVGTVTDNRKSDRLVAYMMLNAGESFLSDRPSTWADIESVRIMRTVIRGEDVLVDGPRTVGEWPVSRPRFESCLMIVETAEGPEEVTFPNAITFEDDSLTGLLQDEDVVAYDAYVVIAGVELRCDMFAQPASAAYKPGRPPSVPTCVAPAGLELTPAMISRTAPAGEAIPGADLQLRNRGSQAISWTAASSAPWVAAETASGTLSAAGTTNLTLTFGTTGLAPGPAPYNATITITGSGGAPVATAQVTLLITPHNSVWMLE